jgi:nucleotide-binding universal stress UspA family protein
VAGMGASTRSRRRFGSHAARKGRRKPSVLTGYKRLLVPITSSRESEKAMAVAARIAREHRSSITALAIVEVPPLLPADAHMPDEEATAHVALSRAAAIADSYGVKVSAQMVQARDAAAAIVDQVVARDIESIVVGGPRRGRTTRGVSMFGSTVEHVLKNAPCRVIVVGPGTPAA